MITPLDLMQIFELQSRGREEAETRFGETGKDHFDNLVTALAEANRQIEEETGSTKSGTEFARFVAKFFNESADLIDKQDSREEA